MNRRIALPNAPIHPLSSVVTIVLDSAFGAAEIALPFSLPVTMALVFVCCTMSVTLTQRFLSLDSWGAAIAKGFAMGLLSGVPLPVMGTAAGTLLLGWSGLSSLTK